MSYVTLTIGDPAPWFAQRLCDSPRFVFDTAAGRYIVLCFFAKAADQHARRAIDAVFQHRSIFNDKIASFFGVTKRYDHALQVMKALPYGWREYSAEDTLRFYALRLHEVGMLKSTPQKLLAQGTDWRFFNELKKELKM